MSKGKALRATRVNWGAVKRAWLKSGGRGARALAARYQVAHTTIIRRAKREHWADGLASQGLASFLIDGRKVCPARASFEDVDRIRAANLGMVRAAARDFPRLDQPDIESLFSTAILDACKNFRRGDAHSFNALLWRVYNNALTTAARKMTPRVRLEVLSGEIDIISTLPMEDRPLAAHLLAGGSETEFADACQINRAAVSKQRKQMQKVLAAHLKGVDLDG